MAHGWVTQCCCTQGNLWEIAHGAILNHYLLCRNETPSSIQGCAEEVRVINCSRSLLQAEIIGMMTILSSRSPHSREGQPVPVTQGGQGRNKAARRSRVTQGKKTTREEHDRAVAPSTRQESVISNNHHTCSLARCSWRRVEQFEGRVDKEMRYNSKRRTLVAFWGCHRCWGI